MNAREHNQTLTHTEERIVSNMAKGIAQRSEKRGKDYMEQVLQRETKYSKLLKEIQR